MPWGVRKCKNGKGHEVYKKDTGRAIKGGRHATEKEALAHKHAIEINYHGKGKKR